MICGVGPESGIMIIAREESRRRMMCERWGSCVSSRDDDGDDERRDAQRQERMVERWRKRKGKRAARYRMDEY